MVHTRNSQQRSESQSTFTTSSTSKSKVLVSDSEEDDEVLDIVARKQKEQKEAAAMPAVTRSRRGGRSASTNTNKLGNSHEAAHNGNDTAPVTPEVVEPEPVHSQRSTRSATTKFKKVVEPEPVERDDDDEEDDVDFELNGGGDGDRSSFVSTPDSVQDDDFDLNNSQSQSSQDEDEGNGVLGQRRSQRQVEKSQNQSWMAMEVPSAKGYPTRRGSTTHPRTRSGSRGQVQAGQARDMNGQLRQNNDEEPNDDQSSHQGLYTRLKTRPRPRRSLDFTGGSTTPRYSPRKLQPVASRLRARNPKSYNITETYRRMFRRADSRTRRTRNGGDSDSSDDEEVPRKRKKAILMSNDGSQSQQLAGGIEGFEPIKPDTSINFSSVGGLDDFIQKIREVILFPMLYKPFYENRRITPPRGLLLFGPPGTGKTLLARAIAGEATRINGKPVSFFMLKGSEVQTKWVGESEKALRELFKTATNCQPSIIFFDEFDGLAAHRSIKTDQFHNSLVSTFLAELDGLRDRGQIIVIGATNRVEAIDPAFRRAGRLDFELQFRLPDYNARREIIAIHTKDWPDAPVGREMEELASLTSGYNGADLKLICSQACLNALKRRYPQIYKRQEKLAIDYESVKVLHIDFVQALEVVPRSSFRSTLAITALPLPELLRPILHRSVEALKEKINYIFQIKNPGLISPSRKRILIFGESQYIVPAVLYTMDTVSVSAISTQSITLSESEARAILAAFSEASVKRGVLYIQDIDKVYKMLNPMGRLVLHQELNKVDDVSLVLATATDPIFPEELAEFFEDSHFELLKTTSEERNDFFSKIFMEEAYRVRIEIPPPEEEELDVAEADVLSQEDLQVIEKRENRKLRGLRIFLRETLQKLVRNKKFVEFTTAVNVEEVPDYLNIIANPMHFEMMMAKVNSGEYLSSKMFLKDIDLIVTNCLEYNPDSTNEGKQIRLKAHALRDEALDLIESQLDSDFEAECERIAAEREDRKHRDETQQVKSIPKKVLKSPARRKRSRDNPVRSRELNNENDDLGFRTTPNLELYRAQMDRYLSKLVQATEKSTLLELTAVRFQLSCACQQYYDSENKEALLAKIDRIVSSAALKKPRKTQINNSANPLVSLPPAPQTPRFRGRLGSKNNFNLADMSDDESEDVASTSTASSSIVRLRTPNQKTNGYACANS